MSQRQVGGTGDGRLTRWQRLQASVLHELERKLLALAFLTVLLVAVVQQTAMWKFFGVTLREAAAVVQMAVLPWVRTAGEPAARNARVPQVVTLLIGDELFVDPSGFNHRVPLEAEPLRAYLSLALQTADKEALVFIDFDLAPRRDDDLYEAKERKHQSVHQDRLAQDLGELGSRLFLVEPDWAVAHPPTFAKQVAWVRKLCHPVAAAPGQPAAGAIFVQSTIQSQFGLVKDRLALKDQTAGLWDAGRAVTHHLAKQAPPLNPICARLDETDAQAPAGSDAHLRWQLLQAELRLAGQMTLRNLPPPCQEPQGFVNRVMNSCPNELALRSEWLLARLQPVMRFNELSQLAALKQARVVVVGGGWSHGQTDRHETYAGTVDGAVVHAGWIKSWAQPVQHLPKLLEVIFNVLVIELLLHPALESAFKLMRRNQVDAKQARGASLRTVGTGIHSWYIVLGLLWVVGTVVVVALLLAMADGLLRLAWDMTLNLDGEWMTLLVWIVVVAHRVSTQRADKEPFEKRHGLALLFLLAITWAAVHLADRLMAWRHDAYLNAFAWVYMSGLLVCAAAAGWQHSDLDTRRLRQRWCHFWTALFGHIWRPIKGLGLALYATFCALLCGRRRWQKLPLRWAAALGDLAWLAVWGLALYGLFIKQLWVSLLATLGGFGT